MWLSLQTAVLSGWPEAGIETLHRSIDLLGDHSRSRPSRREGAIGVDHQERLDPIKIVEKPELAHCPEVMRKPIRTNLPGNQAKLVAILDQKRLARRPWRPSPLDHAIFASSATPRRSEVISTLLTDIAYQAPPRLLGIASQLSQEAIAA